MPSAQNTSENAGTEPAPRRRKWRLWIPITVVLLATSAISWLHLTENTFRTHGLQIFSMIGLFLIVIWFIFLSGNPARIKWILSGVLLALCAAAGTAASLGFVRLKLADGSGWFTLDFGSAAKLPKFDFSGAGSTTSGSDNASSQATARFLGPLGDGSVPGPPLATDWSQSPPQELWRRPIGSGWSSFAVASGKAVTMEQREGEELTVCYQLETGNPLWVSKTDVRFVEGMGGAGPRATPTISGIRVYAYGATGILKCLDLESGSEIWNKDILGDFNSANTMYGMSGSPLISGENVVVSAGKSGPTLIALRQSDGEVAWKSGSRKSSYASPVLATIGGGAQILSVNAESLTGHDPETGEELWVYPWIGGFPKVGQPVAVGHNRVLVTAAYAVGSHLVEVKKGADGNWKAAQIWRSERLKTKFSSALIHGQHAYGLDSGRFACIDLETGERVWKDGRYGFGQNLLVGDVVLVQAERGDVVLVAADPSGHRELARLPALDAKSWSAPTLAGDFLLVRSEDEAACFRLARTTGGSAPPTP